MEESDLILVNTCSIREKAEETVRKRLKVFEVVKRQRPGLKVGVLGCMAERLKKKWLEEEKLVDLVVGPDAYRDLPALIVALVGIGLLTLFIGLIVTMPLVGHATWHAYKDLVDTD